MKGSLLIFLNSLWKGGEARLDERSKNFSILKKKTWNRKVLELPYMSDSDFKFKISCPDNRCCPRVWQKNAFFCVQLFKDWSTFFFFPYIREYFHQAVSLVGETGL